MDTFEQLRSAGVVQAALALGVECREREIACPACRDRTRHTKRGDHRLSAGIERNGRGWRCFQCDVGGDAVTLAALVVTGKRLERGAPEWPDVIERCRSAGLVGPDVKFRALPDERNEPKRPPAAEVATVWRESIAVTGDTEVAAWLRSRALDPLIVAEQDLARVLPDRLPSWAVYLGAPWGANPHRHRLAVPLRDPRGERLSLHARAMTPAASHHKAASPRGCAVAGLTMANPTATQMLEARSDVLGVVVAEGVPDFLTWATVRPDLAVLGVISGSWSPDLGERIPKGTRVAVRAHLDDAGDKYAATIVSTLGHCNVFRRK